MQALTTVEYADKYFLTKPNAEAWEGLTEVDKQRLLFEATRRIYAIVGFKYTPEVIELLSAIPDDLQQACCEVCFNLVESNNGNNVHETNQKMGIASISFGKDSVSYDKSIKTSVLGLDNSIFSDYAQSILNKYIIKGFNYV